MCPQFSLKYLGLNTLKEPLLKISDSVQSYEYTKLYLLVNNFLQFRQNNSKKM